MKRIIFLMVAMVVLLTGCESGGNSSDLVVKNEIKESTLESGAVQIRDSICYIGGTLSEWTASGVEILPNTTVYDECIVLGIDEVPICRLYVDSSNAMLMEDAIVKSVYYGISWDSSINQEAAKSALESPAPIACSSGIIIGQDYTEVENILGVSSSISDTSDDTIMSYGYPWGDNSYLKVFIDRMSGKVCGIIYGKNN